MFQFPGFALKTLCIQVKSICLYILIAAPHHGTVTRYIQMGFPIQKSMDQSLFSAPHGLSQSITSFIASYCLGIHQTPFSRLIWSRKSQTDLRQNVKQPADNTLVHMPSLSLVKSHTFPPEYMSVYSDYERHKSARVSLLDLDNSVHFSSGYRQKVEERPNLNAFLTYVRNQTEIIPSLRAIKQCW